MPDHGRIRGDLPPGPQPDPEEAASKALAAGRARTDYVLSDSSKFGTVTAAAMFPLEMAQIITDHLPDKRFFEYTIIKEV